MSDTDLIIAAARDGDYPAVVRLLDKDRGLVNAMNMLGSQPIHAAHFGGHGDIVALLLQKGVALDIFLAAELGMLDRVSAALNKGPTLATAFRPNGGTALHGACYWGQVEVVRLLLDHGADPNVATRDEFLQIRPLGAAVATPDVPNPSDEEQVVLDLVRRLLDQGADVNGRRRDGLTALHGAAYRGHARVAALLLERGADPSITGYDGAGPHAGQTAADMAREQGHDELAPTLTPQ